LSNRWRPVVRLHWDWPALKPQRGLRPVVGQSQELRSLLFGPSPRGPPEAISSVFVIFVDRGHVPLHLMVSGAQPVSQPPHGGRKIMRLSARKWREQNATRGAGGPAMQALARRWQCRGTTHPRPACPLAARTLPPLWGGTVEALVLSDRPGLSTSKSRASIFHSPLNV
jgi:hypothetical protein